MDYRIKVEPDDNETLLVTCPALPEVTTFAETARQVPRMAQKAIEEAIAARISQGEVVPCFRSFATRC